MFIDEDVFKRWLFFRFKSIYQLAVDHIKELKTLISEDWEQLETPLESLKTKSTFLEGKIKDFEKDMLIHKQLVEENLSLDKWMDEVNKFLHAEEVAWGDVEVLEAQLEQSNVIVSKLFQLNELNQRECGVLLPHSFYLFWNDICVKRLIRWWLNEGD